MLQLSTDTVCVMCVCVAEEDLAWLRYRLRWDGWQSACFRVSQKRNKSDKSIKESANRANLVGANKLEPPDASLYQQPTTSHMLVVSNTPTLSGIQTSHFFCQKMTKKEMKGSDLLGPLPWHVGCWGCLYSSILIQKQHFYRYLTTVTFYTCMPIYLL